MDISDNQHTAFGFVPDKNTSENPASETTPSWKNNLSKRWSKKQPTKSELCDISPHQPATARGVS